MARIKAAKVEACATRKKKPINTVERAFEDILGRQFVVTTFMMKRLGIKKLSIELN